MSRRRKPADPVGPPMPDIDSKCGWCMTGHHDQCRPSTYSHLTGATYTCDCVCRRDTINHATTTTGE